MPDRDDRDARLEETVAHLAHLLPAQGPIGIFIHHNTLHAYESLDFEEAVVAAGEKLSCEPFLPEEEYRAEFARGRITQRDLQWALREDLGAEADRPAAAGLSLLELRARVARWGIPDAGGSPLVWLLQETDVLRRFREDLPPEAARALSQGGSARALWESCRDAARRSPHRARPEPLRDRPRHRDLLLAATGEDCDAWVHPTLIRLVGAFLDQGLARWTMPGRSRGLYACFLDLYSHSWSSLCGAWAAGLPDLVREERRLRAAPMASLRRSLEELGVGSEEEGAFLEATALSLRGWAGMVRQMEERPDRVPARSLPASLTEFLAVRLILDRAALSYAAGRLPEFGGGLAELRDYLRIFLARIKRASPQERSWDLFHAAQLCGLSAARVAALPDEEVGALERELGLFGSVDRRRILQAAYDRHLRSRVCDALVSHEPRQAPPSPAFQAVFCLDEREESIRRHLEEAAPEAETFGAAGFYGVAMYYQGATDAHPRPLCPIAIQPSHYVGERKTDPSAPAARWRLAGRRQAGRLGRLLHRLSGTVLGGTLLTTIMGPLSIVPLILRVIFPLSPRRWRRLLPYSQAPATRLVLDRQEAPPAIGEHYGYTKEEMSDIVAGLLRGLGVSGRLSPLVVVAGHGSTSLNNPHESAHDCGACGGGRGGPNARALAQMANDPEVRELLSRRGLAIPAGTWFVGAQRNTADNSVKFFDLDLLPQERRELFARAEAAFGKARRREARERCRRFESCPTSASSWAALEHVSERARDLAQPRPEYGHASNAFCVVGRRARTRGLFLDRRAYLVSYDPTQDEGGRVLERTLAAVVPVVAGISLEYYFSRVDPSGYGCATKLPHNVACLLGVMDGAQSDLRTGLPWQMVEIHEPVRLFMAVESPTERFERILERQAATRRLLERRWMFAACLDPGSQDLRVWERGRWSLWTPEEVLPRAGGDSASWYQGRRDHLPLAELSR